MNLIYDSLSIDGKQSDAFTKARDWRKTNCGAEDLNKDLTKSAGEFVSVINTPVALRAFESYDTCIQASSLGIHCRGLRYSDQTIGLFVSYIPDAVPGGVLRAPKIVTATVDNAHLSGTATDHSVLKPGRVVPPGGLAADVVQDDRSKDVVFDVQLSAGFPSCQPKDLIVKAAPAYVVSAEVTVDADRTTTAIFQNSRRIVHQNCRRDLHIPVAIQVCPSPGYVLDVRPGTLDWDALQNPGNPPGKTKYWCFGAVNGTIDSPPDANGCVNTTVEILECARDEDNPACEASWIDGANFGSTAIARLNGTKIDHLLVGPFDHTWPDAEGGGILTLETPGLPNDASTLVPKWGVNITNSITKQTVVLSQPGKQSDADFNANYDYLNHRLIVYLPK